MTKEELHKELLYLGVLVQIKQVEFNEEWNLVETGTAVVAAQQLRGRIAEDAVFIDMLNKKSFNGLMGVLNNSQQILELSQYFVGGGDYIVKRDGRLKLVEGFTKHTMSVSFLPKEYVPIAYNAKDNCYSKESVTVNLIHRVR